MTACSWFAFDLDRCDRVTFITVVIEGRHFFIISPKKGPMHIEPSCCLQVKNDSKLCLTAEKTPKMLFFATCNFMTFPKVTLTLDEGKYCLYWYVHGSCTPLGYKDCLQVIFDSAVKITVTESVKDYKAHTRTHTHTHTLCRLISDIRLKAQHTCIHKLM